MSFDSLKKRFRTYDGQSLPAVDQIRTGIMAIDYVTSGGIPVGRLVEMFGPNNVGKSTTALTIIKSFQAAGKSAAYVDAERLVQAQDLDRLGVDKDKVLFQRPDNAEDAVSFMKAAAEAGVGIIVVDSLPALIPQSQCDRLDADPGAAEMGIKARFWSSNQSVLYSITEGFNCTILVINQLRSSLSPYASGPSTPGGVAIPFVATNRLQLKSNGKSAEELKSITHLQNSFRTTFYSVKSKTGPSYLSGSADYTAYGIDPYTSLILKAKEEGVIKTAGANYSFDEEIAEAWQIDPKITRGMPGVYKYFQQNLETSNKLYDLLIERSRTKRTPPQDTDPPSLDDLLKAEANAES